MHAFALTVPLAAVLIVLGVGAGVTARGGWRETLSPSGRWGIRTPAAARSERAFRMANKVAAPVFGGAAAVGIVAGLLTVALPLSAWGATIVFVLGLAGAIALLAAGGLLGEQAARTLPIPARKPQPSAACSGCNCGGGGCSVLTRSEPAPGASA